MNLVRATLTLFRKAINSVLRAHGIGTSRSPAVGLTLKGRTIIRVVREIKAEGCPETLLVARFDDGFYGVVAEQNRQLRFFDAYPLNEQFTQLAACMEQLPDITASEGSTLNSLRSVEIQVSPDYVLIFDINRGTPEKWDLRGFIPLRASFTPRSASDHPLDGANLEELNPMIFDPSAIKKK